MIKKINKKNVVRGLFCLFFVLVVLGVIVSKLLPENKKNNVGNVASDEENVSVPVDYNTDVNYDNADEHESIRVRTKYKILDVSIEQNISSEDMEYIDELYKKSGKVSDGVSLVKIKVEVTNVGEEQQEIYLNSNNLCMFDSSTNESVSTEMVGVSNPENKGKSLFEFVLQPQESTTQTCYYLLDNDYLNEKYNLKYCVNPCGQPRSGNIGSGDPNYNVDDYISYIDITSMLN